MTNEVVKVVADIFPASITPRPAEVPGNAKIRVVLAETEIVIAWLAGRVNGVVVIGQHRIPVTAEDTAGATYRGGTVGEYEIGKGVGCSCGAAALKNWNPYEGATIVARKMAPATGASRYTRA